MIVCPSSLHSCVQGTNFPPSEPPGEIMSFGVSPVNYSDSEAIDQANKQIVKIINHTRLLEMIELKHRNLISRFSVTISGIF